MSAIWRSFEPASLLPEELRAAIGRRVREIGGVALLAVAGGLGIALATWSVQDPSLTHATKAPVPSSLSTLCDLKWAPIGCQ